MNPARSIAVLLLIVLLQLSFYLLPDSKAWAFSFEIGENTISAAADNVPLQTILLELAAADVTVKIDPQINPPVTVDFKDRPIEEALEALLKPASYSLLWESSGSNDASSLRLAEIRVFRSGQEELMQTLKPARKEIVTRNKAGVFFVRDELLLYIAPGTDLSELRKLLLGYQATMEQNTGLPGLIKILFPEDSDVFAIAAEIKKKLNIGIIQPNYAYPIGPPVAYTAASIPEGISPAYYAPTGNSAPVAILDSGLADNSELDKFVLASLDAVHPDMAISDTLGHGTQMALIVSGVAKPYGAVAGNESYVPIIPIRAFDDNGFTNDFKVMDAINFALANNARGMSLSWGSETRSDFLEKAFAYANAKGLIIVASAGNEPTGRPVYPAAYPSTIGVGALDLHGRTWENSNYGNFVTLYAPGFANLPVGYKGDPGLYAGTSIAAAYVAHTIAGYLSENPGATLQEISKYLNSKF